MACPIYVLFVNEPIAHERCAKRHERRRRKPNTARSIPVVDGAGLFAESTIGARARSASAQARERA